MKEEAIRKILDGNLPWEFRNMTEVQYLEKVTEEEKKISSSTFENEMILRGSRGLTSKRFNTG